MGAISGNTPDKIFDIISRLVGRVSMSGKQL
jgi:hypothetical protein